MSSSLPGQLQQSLAGATFGAGFFEWMSANTSLVNTWMMILTAIGALYFGYVNSESGKKRSLAMDEANRINSHSYKRGVIDSAVKEMRLYGVDEESIERFKNNLRR